ncbi:MULTISPECIES: AraC family transcriptional regulator [unclassified Pseudofrankia]|uniref:helix-turn-helix domain-containing protein n=1 Tax=unclassified Pseudofrankia TaxID=2994372 RepID=UPI001F52368F|nr:MULTISPECIES: helix-turn-helix domain-containing protein [unclassified Pseudofrankia]MDT3439866.1 helix-turn-helix domain-containing protein [Pseudofrankia sp. BMG5.37]
MSWRRYLLESRLLKAIALLAQDGQNENVSTVALAVGLQSVSAFTRAFGQYTGRRRPATASASTPAEPVQAANRMVEPHPGVAERGKHLTVGANRRSWTEDTVRPAPSCPGERTKSFPGAAPTPRPFR